MNVYPARSNQIAARMLGDEMMIMSPRDATLFSLNEAGALIWQSADGHTPVSEIVQRVCQEFDVEPDEARADVESFLSELAGHRILNFTEEAQ
ncbi:PqqD family protein [Nevskia soli]|jgi:hypothetical protein|uniref:PqqD family protein n=1 Tax=Nevskia soli TaxID=418856 RepID=UPI0015D885C7|nr:PqqD family protein [Nevskia soli]